jgi:prepilin-type N-terminal cleavage/methylation domain-containing protein
MKQITTAQIFKSTKGFTIIELMIATSVFSVILLIASSGVIQIGRLYYKGVTQARVQETARNISEEISRSLQFSNNGRVNGSASNIFCVGDSRYIFHLNQKVSPPEGKHGILEQKIGDGSCNDPPPSGGKELLGTNMRVLVFSVEPQSYDGNSYKIHIKIAYGDDELLTHHDNNGNRIDLDGANGIDQTGDLRAALCKAGPGNSFCAVSELDTIAKRRLISE